MKQDQDKPFQPMYEEDIFITFELYLTHLASNFKFLFGPLVDNSCIKVGYAKGGISKKTLSDLMKIVHHKVGLLHQDVINWRGKVTLITLMQ